MATLPAAGYLSNASRTNAEMQAALEEVRDFIAELPGGSTRTELTIATGAIVPPDGSGGGHHTVDTEGAAATDDLTNLTLTNTPTGRVIRLYAENASRVVTCKHGAGGSGEMQMIDGADFVLDALDKWIEFQLRSTTWVEVGRNYGVGGFRRALTGTVLCPHKSLVALRPSASTVDVDADYVVLAKSNGELKQFASLNETIDITASGANGLDTGSEASSTWYHIWGIGKIDGTLDAVLSTSATAPTLPTGYDFFGYLGACYNDSSSDLVSFHQLGGLVAQAVSLVLNAGTATTYTSISLAAEVPTTARSVIGSIFVADTASAVESARFAADSNGVGAAWVTNPGGSTNVTGAPAEILMPTAQTIYYLTGTNGEASLRVSGWRF